MSAPSWARRRAIPRPMPWPAPVTSTTLPVMLMQFLLVSSEPVAWEPVSDLYVTATTMRKGCTVLQFRRMGQRLQPSATLPVSRATAP